MGFANRLSAQQIADILNAGGDVDGGEALSVFEDIDGGVSGTVSWDVTYDGGTASG